MRRFLIVAGAACAVVVVGAALAIVLRYLRQSLRRGTAGPARMNEQTPIRSPATSVDPAPPALAPAPTAASGRTVRSPLTTSPLLTGITLLAVPTATLVGIVFFITVGAPWLLTRQHFPTPPDQPIYFSHEVHVQQAGLDCAFCHRTADRVATAGYPDVQQCMFCHVVVEDIQQATARAAYEGQIAKLRTAWTDKESVEWTRVHRLPDHSRFPHDAHVQAGVACATCHGAVDRMDLAYQVRSLKMADCVACHQQTGAPNECVDCHH